MTINHEKGDKKKNVQDCTDSSFLTITYFCVIFQELREKLATAETFDNTNILAALRGIVNYVQEQWTNSVPVNIVLVTDEG